MTKILTVRLEVKEGEDETWMVEQIRAALVDRDASAHDSVDHFMVAFQPIQVWRDMDIIAWSLLVHVEDESGDAVINEFLLEDPSRASLTAVEFARAYFVWAQGADWQFKQSAQNFMSGQLED